MLTKLRFKNFKAWEALRAVGVSIHFLCEHEIAKKHTTKHGPSKRKRR